MYRVCVYWHGSKSKWLSTETYIESTVCSQNSNQNQCIEWKIVCWWSIGWMETKIKEITYVVYKKYLLNHFSTIAAVAIWMELRTEWNRMEWNRTHWDGIEIWRKTKSKKETTIISTTIHRLCVYIHGRKHLRTCTSSVIFFPLEIEAIN